MQVLKKIGKFLSSMRFAIILLVVLAAACALGSLVTQGQSYAWYAQKYNERVAALILAFRLDDTYHSWWFLLITGFLCLNLLTCNVLRLPGLIRRTREWGDAARCLEARGDAEAVSGDPKALMRRLRMPAPKVVQTKDGAEALFSAKNSAGLWGAWVCHLGILLLILGFSLGQMTQKQYTVYGVPGQTRTIGDTGYMLTIDDFTVALREDDTVEQYTARFTVSDGQTSRSAQAQVNHPASLYGMKFYQNSTGWAANVSVTQGGEPLQEEILCAGEYLRVKNLPDLVVYFNAFYPDYVASPGSMPATASARVNNPAYLYSVYYQDQMLGMNVLMGDEPLTVDDYAVIFSQPQYYTLIQVKEDHFTSLAFLGGLVTMLGLLLAFYVQPVRMWARREDGAWVVRGACRKGGALFRQRFERAAGGEQGGQYQKTVSRQ